MPARAAHRALPAHRPQPFRLASPSPARHAQGPDAPRLATAPSAMGARLAPCAGGAPPLPAICARGCGVAPPLAGMSETRSQETAMTQTAAIKLLNTAVAT